MRKKKFARILQVSSTAVSVAAALCVCGCGGIIPTGDYSVGGSDGPTSVLVVENTPSSGSLAPGGADSSFDVAAATQTAVTTRDCTPVALVPEAPGTLVFEIPEVIVDISNTAEGYIMVDYRGTCPKVKLQITGPSQNTYTYNLHGGYETFPLSSGDGAYTIGVFENISGTQYATILMETANVTMTNAFGPFLYPNQYVDFSPSSQVVNKSVDICQGTATDLDAVTNIYNFVIGHMTYDYDLAANVQSGYLPNPDNALSTGSGICLDYASLMCSLLRIQGIPTHLEVGYAGEAYHAWISTYIEDIGWVNGMIEFNGHDWELMDPTFAANSSESSLREFIGSGDNYTVKYIY